jgi:hypothetical protein
MIDILKEKNAKFKYETCDILKTVFCGGLFFPRSHLRKSVSGRTLLNYQLGEELIDKDLDLANIILKLRQLNIFMKMNLDVDQRKLLKLRGRKLITSDLDEKFSPIVFRKIENKDEMLNIFVDNIRLKELNKKDIKLL